ncbi:MAG TPA: TadE/TadG family type IV pilus assembly protein [Candidatus Sulfotelmatobacter sp.]|nr:TadE/TadG family type IV pilus assembly protein [Candidatus Sulfotelmatobacter sp.]
MTPIRPPFDTPAALRHSWLNEQASQIAEFAVSLPLLVVFIVGIFDFSGAFSLKQKLANAAREGARVAAADPANDLSGSASGVPASVGDAFQIVDNYLTMQKINDCGLSGKIPALGSGLTWSATSKGSCPGSGITFTINRGCVTQQTLGGTATSMVATCVTITYPYAWRFSNVSSLLGTTVMGPSNLTTTAVAYNEN